MWDSDDLPTLQHLELIMWAYSPDASKIKKRLPTLEAKLKEYKVEDEVPAEDKKPSKRRSEDDARARGDSDGDEEPEKKKKGGD